MERLCRECSAPLTGRSDKQFCSDSCRTAFHNRQYRSQGRQTGAINAILRRNRKILSETQAAGLTGIGLKNSRMNGFDRRFFTAMEQRPLHATVYHCYEFSYIIRGGRLEHLQKDS